MTETQSYQFGVVVIGRNEGERLVRCLESVAGHPVVYVDSGSRDASVERSRALGADVVELDMDLPFTAARARNAGAQRLLKQHPELDYIQFVDGDCRVEAGWLETACNYLERHGEVAAVCGRRRELHPHRSRYNLFCDIEWDTPVGQADACGGDAMYRVSAFQAVGQFNEGFIAGEEPELCYRLRQAGWKIFRLDHPMTQHDAAMTRLMQWWKRSERCGYAYALGAWEHGGASTEGYKVKQCLSVVFWAAIIPFSALLLGTLAGVAYGLLWLAVTYGYLAVKIFRANRRQHPGFTSRQLLDYSLSLVAQKFPELIGIIKCSWQRNLGQRMDIIEYK